MSLLVKGPATIIASRVATLLLIFAIVTLYLKHALFARGTVAISLQVAAALLMLWARITFGMRSFHAAANPTEGGLVTTGPYRFMRHPIYAAILLFLWVGVLSSITLVNILLGAIATIAIAVRIGAEETLVTARYPEYAAYAVRTRRIVPFLI
ncbi:MAG: methyltransferase [Gemmatimonadota bacterium]